MGTLSPGKNQRMKAVSCSRTRLPDGRGSRAEQGVSWAAFSVNPRINMISTRIKQTHFTAVTGDFCTCTWLTLAVGCGRPRRWCSKTLCDMVVDEGKVKTSMKGGQSIFDGRLQLSAALELYFHLASASLLFSGFKSCLLPLITANVTSSSDKDVSCLLSNRPSAHARCETRPSPPQLRVLLAGGSFSFLPSITGSGAVA